jgi:hypothetical protein
MFSWDYSREVPPRASVFVDGIRHDWPVHTEKPWLVEIWEPLTTKVPNPCIAQPYCCYINTVIFYLRPYVVRPWHRFWICNGQRRAEKPGGAFEEWGRCETVITWNSVLEVNGQRFEPMGGGARWKQKRWWMRRWARRVANAA